MMASKDDEQRSGFADAAGRAAFFPARAAARAWRRPLEDAVDEVCLHPRSLASSTGRSRVRYRRSSRVRSSAAACSNASPPNSPPAESWSASLQPLWPRRRRSSSLTKCSRATNAARSASCRVESGTSRRDRPADNRASRGGGRRRPCLRHAARRSCGAGRASSCTSRAPDLRRRGDARYRPRGRAAVTTVVFMSVVGIAALVASLVGGLRPEWLVGALLASGWFLIVGTYFVLFWSSAGQTPGMRLLRVRVHGPGDNPPSIGRSSCALLGSCLRSCPCSQASSRCCSRSGDGDSRTSSREPLSCTTIRGRKRCRATPLLPMQQVSSHKSRHRVAGLGCAWGCAAHEQSRHVWHI